jgi:TetR/AcrR family transcriptional regulator
MKTPRTSTRAEQREASRQSVLEAAAELFSHFGFEGTSMNSISDKAGVSKQNMIYYFGSKEGLWEEMLDWLFANVADSFDEVLYKGRSVDQISISDFIRAYFEVCRRHPAYVLIPMLEGVNDTWRSKMIAERYLRRHVERFNRFVSACADRGEISDVEPLHLQNLAAGGAQLFLALAPIWKLAAGKDTTSEKFIREYAETVVRLLKPAS